MKVLMVSPPFFMYGGAERQLVHLANHLTDRNHQVTLLTQCIIPELRCDLKETRILTTPDIGQALQLIMHNYDVLNPHNHPAELLHYPKHHRVVWQCNEPPEAALRGHAISDIEKTIVQKHIQTVSVIDEFNAERFKRLYDKEATVNYPGIRYEMFADLPKEPNDKYGLKDNFVILHAGYLTWTKNQVGSVEILGKVKREVPNAKLVLAGYAEDRYVLQVKQKVEELGLKDDVVITGYLPDDKDLLDLYALADVYIAPLLEQGGWANAFEAVAAGIPTIVSNRMTCSNLFKDNALGIVTQIEDFPKHILEVKNGVIPAQNREWVRDNLSWRSFGERYERLFDAVAGN